MARARKIHSRIIGVPVSLSPPAFLLFQSSDLLRISMCFARIRIVNSIDYPSFVSEDGHRFLERMCIDDRRDCNVNAENRHGFDFTPNHP